MSTKAVPEAGEEGARDDLWQPQREQAPSPLRDEGPSLPRAFFMLGMFLFAFGVVPYLRTTAPYSLTTGNLFLALSLLCFLYHAAGDRDLQIRRTYTFLSL